MRSCLICAQLGAQDFIFILFLPQQALGWRDFHNTEPCTVTQTEEQGLGPPSNLCKAGFLPDTSSDPGTRPRCTISVRPWTRASQPGSQSPPRQNGADKSTNRRVCGHQSAQPGSRNNRMYFSQFRRLHGYVQGASRPGFWGDLSPRLADGLSVSSHGPFRACVEWELRCLFLFAEGR